MNTKKEQCKLMGVVLFCRGQIVMGCMYLSTFEELHSLVEFGFVVINELKLTINIVCFDIANRITI
jgi:hypothetical protein